MEQEQKRNLEHVHGLDTEISQTEHLEAARSRHLFVAPSEIIPPGENAWDHWQVWALEAGIADELAQLGRAVIREAYQHNWPETLKAECGWFDSGQEMLRLAKTDPERAEARWRHLLSTDGGLIQS